MHRGIQPSVRLSERALSPRARFSPLGRYRNSRRPLDCRRLHRGTTSGEQHQTTLSDCSEVSDMSNQIGVPRRAVLKTLVAGGAALAGGALLPGTAASAQVPVAASRPPGGWGAAAADVRNELLHNWNSYKRLAWGHDQLLPVSGSYSEFFDPAHPVGLTIVEALDTLYLMGLDAELAEGVAWLRDQQLPRRDRYDHRRVRHAVATRRRRQVLPGREEGDEGRLRPAFGTEPRGHHAQHRNRRVARQHGV